METKTDSKSHYVDNVLFQSLLVKRKSQLDQMTEGSPKPKVCDGIGAIILKIADNLSYRRNFINYSFREEMVGDAIENCIRYVDNYDTINYKNPFAYFTQMCFYAFVRRITREDKDAKGRLSVYEKQAIELGITDNLDLQFAINDDPMRGAPTATPVQHDAPMPD